MPTAYVRKKTTTCFTSHGFAHGKSKTSSPQVIDILQLVSPLGSPASALLHQHLPRRQCLKARIDKPMFHKDSNELCFFWLWGIIILLVPTRGLRLAYAATVGAYAGTSCRKFAYAAYARVVLLKRCLRGYSPGSFSPPVRWGLLDFMWVVFSASSSSPLRPPCPQLRWCELSVPCRTSTAIVWVQRSVPDLNRDHV